MNNMTDCLEGIKVVDLSRNLPGPFASRLLADLGAEIVKIEPKHGDPARALGPLFEALNHGKTLEKLDFRSEEDIETVKTHIKNADVLLNSFRSGVLDGMGLSDDTLTELNPKLVVVSILGYGVESAQVSHGWGSKAGHDINFMAMSGVLDQLKTSDGDQAMPNIQFADLAGGSDTAVIALLAALIAANRTGQGRHISISMAHSLYQHMVMPKATGEMVKNLMGKQPPPHQDFLGGLLPCYRLYKTSDDRYMAVGSLELKFWQGLCDVLLLPHLKDKHWQRGIMPGTPDSDQALEEVKKAFASQPMRHWQEKFATADVCVTPVLTLAEASQHALFEHQDAYGATAGWQVL